MKKKIDFMSIIFAVVMLVGTIVAFTMEKEIFGENSVFNNSVSDNLYVNMVYNKIPALIRTIQIITVAWIINKTVSGILKASVKGSKRGGAIATLLGSFIKYGIAIAAILYVLSVWGADVASLVTGVGILTLIIGLGAQSLVADIIAGFFIVFEGEFHVGDIVIIDGWKGTISDIGIRTTKIVSIGGDVKTINNSQISSVINLSEKLSSVACTIDIDYSENLERVEAIINSNLDDIQSRIPKIVNKIMYLGVCGLGVNYMSLLIVAPCQQVNCDEVNRALLRELKLLIDRNGIKKPKPTMYFSQDFVS